VPAPSRNEPEPTPSDEPLDPPPAAVEAEPEAVSASGAAALEILSDASAAGNATFEEVSVPDESVIGIRLDAAISSETARLEDQLTAQVTRDVMIDGRTVIPAGARLEGTVTEVQRAGRLRQRARLGMRFTTLLLTNNLRVPIQTETIFRDGDSPGKEAASKIGASAVVGAILGAVIGGKKGAAIGGTAGAAGGTAATMASDRNEVTIPAGASLTVRLTSPVKLTVERQR
jgi:hypothetical protein